MREQTLYMSKLRELVAEVSRQDALTILGRVPDIETDDGEVIVTAKEG